MCVARGTTSDENKSDSVVNTRAFTLPFSRETRGEGGCVDKGRLTRCVYGDGARYFAVETHRGHISLDLAKQSEHLNFKYGVYVSR